MCLFWHILFFVGSEWGVKCLELLTAGLNPKLDEGKSILVRIYGSIIFLKMCATPNFFEYFCES